VAEKKMPQKSDVQLFDIAALQLLYMVKVCSTCSRTLDFQGLAG